MAKEQRLGNSQAILVLRRRYIENQELRRPTFYSNLPPTHRKKMQEGHDVSCPYKSRQDAAVPTDEVEVVGDELGKDTTDEEGCGSSGPTRPKQMSAATCLS